MVVLILQRAPASLRGELSRWMIEPRAGVFVGNVSAMARDKLWEWVVRAAPEAGAVMVHSAQTEQGFRVRAYGDSTREIVGVEGLQLVHIPQRKRERDTKATDESAP